MKLNYGDFAAQQVSERIGTPVDTLTTLKAIPADRRVAGQVFLVLADNTLWKFHSSSTLPGDDVLVATPGSGSGRFLRMPGAGKSELAFTFATGDTAALLTMQAGQELAVERVLLGSVTGNGHNSGAMRTPRCATAKPNASASAMKPCASRKRTARTGCECSSR